MSAFKTTRSSRRLKNTHSEEKQQQPFFSKATDTAFFQPKLTIGQPGDKYEQEADAVADSVVNKTNQQPSIQQQKISSIQRESLATPLEDEKFDTAEDRMEKDKLIQEKPELQRVGEEEEEGMVNKMDDDKEDLQTKSTSANPNTASPQMTQKIKGKAGKGRGLAPNVQAEMESSMGVDLSGVNVHTDTDAVEMNQSLRAQAFTHGKDVFFNSGKYNPDTSEGKHLLAHELTHVVQQTDAIQTYRDKSSFNFGAVDNESWKEEEFKSAKNQPWIKQINIKFTSSKKDSKAKDTWSGTMDIIYETNGHELSNFSIPISGGSIQAGKSDPGNFTVHRIEGYSYNSGTYTDQKDLNKGVGPGKRYTKDLGGANMHLAVFYNRGEAIHIGELYESSHGCIHVGPGDAIKMRQINYHSVIGKTKVKVSY